MVSRCENSTHVTPELMIVMPVFNEESSVEKVIHEWFAGVGQEVENFVLLAIDDGSADSTPRILQRLAEELGPRLEVVSRPNKGHGQTCLEGYRLATERGIPFILQIDSDGQSDPRYFGEFWEQRTRFEVIYGKRLRGDGFRRILASFVLRASLQWIAKVNCVDANVPYRLMNTKACAGGISQVPEETFLANVVLAVILTKNPALSHGSIPIGFPPRRGGEPSVPMGKFAEKAVELFKQMKQAGIC